MTYGNIYTRQQKYPSARKIHWKAIEIDPTYHVPWLNLSVLDMQDMDYDKVEVPVTQFICQLEIFQSHISGYIIYPSWKDLH